MSTPNDSNDSKTYLHVHSLHALAYCERLFYLEEVENIKVANAAVYAGRRLHVELARDEDTDDWLNFTLESEKWGLIGKIDCARQRNGQLIPYEHKKGRSASSKGVAQAWPSDRLQIIAYAAIVAEHTNQPIVEGRIRYHADNILVRVPIDETAYEFLQQSIERAQELLSSVDRPPVTTNERLCAKCSLAPVCLPEEARLAVEPERKTLRLFPNDDDRTILHVLTPGAYVGRKGDRLEISSKDEPSVVQPINEVSQVVLHGFAQITTQALRLCAQHDINVHWVTTGGQYSGTYLATAGSVQRRIRQYRALTDNNICLQLAKCLVEARVKGQLSFLLRASRDAQRNHPDLVAAIVNMRKLLAPIGRADTIDSLRGYEGSMGRHYFSALPYLITPEIDDLMRPDGRSRRPPRDRCNALLSFGYALLLKDVINAILVVGLDSCLGFYHQPRTQAPPLALDLMELFRVPIVDLAIIASINRRQWDADADFQIAGQQVWLSDTGKKKFIAIYERRKADQWKHPVIGHSLSYARLIELEVRLLEKEWQGEGGLFARLRLR